MILVLSNLATFSLSIAIYIYNSRETNQGTRELIRALISPIQPAIQAD
jgi:predicted permease